MWTLSRSPQPEFHDPAPSRMAYRMQRLLLTPLIRGFVRLGLPVFGAILMVGIFVADETRRQNVSDWAADVKSQIANRPEFLVRGMSIDGASDALVLEIREILPLDFPVSSFDLDLKAMQAAVVELAPVAEAGLVVGSGGMLRLTISERMPVLVWRSEAGLALLDADGERVATIDRRLLRPDLPLIAGQGAEAHVPEALAILAAAGPLRERLRGLTYVGGRRWDIVMDRNQLILLPEYKPVAALEQVLALHQAQDILDRDIAVIDMRTPRRATLRLAAGAQEELRRIRQLETGALQQ